MPQKALSAAESLMDTQNGRLFGNSPQNDGSLPQTSFGGFGQPTLKGSFPGSRPTKSFTDLKAEYEARSKMGYNSDEASCDSSVEDDRSDTSYLPKPDSTPTRSFTEAASSREKDFLENSFQNDSSISGSFYGESSEKDFEGLFSKPTNSSSPRLRFQSMSISDSSSTTCFTPSSSEASSSAPRHIPSTYASLHNATPSPRRIAVPVSRKKGPSESSVISSTPTLPSSSLDKSQQSTAPTSRRSSYTVQASSPRATSVTTPNPLSRQAELAPEKDETEARSSSLGDDESGGNRNNPDSDEDVYKMREEILPSAPIYDQRLQSGLRDVKKSLGGLVRKMNASNLARDKSSKLHSLCADTEKMSNFRYPERRTVGFIGDSGVGKSSLINCLLDRINLARSSGEGSACTCVVTEFRNVDDEHKIPFTLEADFMNVEERGELLHELLRSVRQAYTSAFQEVTSTKEQENIRASGLKAWQTFQTVFSNKPGMSLEFLSNEKDESAESKIRAKLENWALAELAKRPGGTNTDKYTKFASNLEDCRENLDYLTTSSSIDGGPVLWPFIKIIRVYLDSSILRTGLVLADLPGLRDLNFARVRATEKYMAHHCDEVFIVAGIKRAVTDESIPEIIRICKGDQQKRIICTQSEAISPEEVARDSKSQPEHAQRVRQMIQRRKDLKESITQVRSRLEKSTTGSQASVPLVLEFYKLEKQERELTLELTTLLINTRNENTQRRLTRKYNNIQVFCVSNTMYRDHREDPQDYAEAYINLSGILELRRYCQLVPAEAGLRATRAFLTHQVPALLGSLRQWALVGSDSVSAERAASLRWALETVETTLHNDLVSRSSHINQFRDALNRSFHEYILHVISSSKRDWTRSCLQVSSVWAGWHHTSYAAFCRKNGTHCTEAVKYHCWNDELVQRPRQDLRLGWDYFTTYLESQDQTLPRQIKSVFESVCRILNEHLSLAPQVMQNFLNTMEYRESCVIDHVRDSIEKMIQSTGDMRRDMLQGHDSSYMADLMRPAYADCSTEGGPGSDRRRKGIMRDHLADPGLFNGYMSRAKVEYGKFVTEQLRFLRQKIKEQVEDITRDSQIVIPSENEPAEADRASEVAEELNSRLPAVSNVLGETQSILREVTRP